MKSSSTILITVLGAVSLLGCEDIIGEKGGQDAAGSAETGLAAPPAAKVALQQPVEGATRPAGAPGKPAKTVGAVPNGNPALDAATDASRDDDDDEPTDADATEDPTPKKKIEERGERDDDKKRERDLDADLTVKRLVISKGVKGREPVGASNAFIAGAQDRIYAFVEVGNRDQVASELYITFIDQSTGKGGRVPLQVGAGARWRTWVYTRSAKKPGKWRAVVKNAKGKTLASQSFEITGDVVKTKGPVDDEKAGDKKAKTDKSDKAKTDKAKTDKAKTDKAKTDKAKTDKSDETKPASKKADDEKTAPATKSDAPQKADASAKASEPKKASGDGKSKKTDKPKSKKK